MTSPSTPQDATEDAGTRSPLVGLVDLHTHVLPGVDDGSDSVEETVAMLRLAHDAGTRRLVATPHIFRARLGVHGAAELRRRFRELQRTLEDLKGAEGNECLAQVRLELAGEHHLSPELFTALKEKAVLPYGEGRRLLVELPGYLAPEGVEAGLDEVIREGYQPLLAHIERYPMLLGNRRRLRRLLDMGCLLQVNAESLVAKDSRLRGACDRLLRRGWVHAIASDAHHAHRRRPGLQSVAQRLQERFGVAKARFWLRDGPTAILDGQTIPPPSKGLRDWWESF